MTEGGQAILHATILPLEKLNLGDAKCSPNKSRSGARIGLAVLTCLVIAWWVQATVVF